MADSKLSALPAGSSIGDTDLFYADQSATSVSVTGAQLAAKAPVQTVAGRTGAVVLASGDVSGLATSATTDATNASNISSGTLAAARLPSGSLLTYVSTSDPVVSNDNTQGYAAGSCGINTNTGRAFVCRSAATGAAVWEIILSADHPGYIASNWYLAMLPGIALQTGGTLSITVTYLAPFLLKQRCTISNLGVRTTTAGSSNLQLALYNNDTSPVNRPGTLIDKTGNIANNGVAGFYSGALGGNQQLEAGLYWTALQCNDTSCIMVTAAPLGSQYESTMGSSAGATVIGIAAGQTVGLTVAGTYGVWGTLHGATFTEVAARSPAITFQVNSIP